jgi:hypothetical protein
LWRFYGAIETAFISTPLYNNNIEAVLINRLYRLKSVEAVKKTASIAVYSKPPLKKPPLQIVFFVMYLRPFSWNLGQVKPHLFA